MMSEHLGNKKRFELNQAKIVTALDNAKYKPLTREELMKITEIGSRRILRKHLNFIKKLVTEIKGSDGKNRFYLTIHYNELKTNTLQSHETWSKLAEYMFSWAKVQGLIPINIDYGEFFSKHGVLFYPEKIERGFTEHFVFCSIDKFDSGSELFRLKPLWNV